MKSITDYFLREKKLDDLGKEEDSTMNSFTEDNPSSDVWVLYSSGDELEDNDNKNVRKKTRLVVQLPQPLHSLNLVDNNKKRKRDLISNESTREDLSMAGEKVMNRSGNSASEKDECSFYMSPLRLESDTSGVSTPRSAHGNNSLNGSSPRTQRSDSKPGSRRSLFTRNCESPSRNQDFKEVSINSGGNEETFRDVESTNLINVKKTFLHCKDRMKDLESYSDQENNVASTKERVNIDEVYDKESNCNFPPGDELNSACNVTYNKSPNYGSKETGVNIPVEMKNDNDSVKVVEISRVNKKRKIDTSNNALDDNPVENQKNLLNYFSKLSESSSEIIVDVSPCSENGLKGTACPTQLDKQNHSPVLKRKSQTHNGTKVIEEKTEKEGVRDLSLSRSISFVNDESTSEASERRSQRLKHKLESSKASPNYKEDDISPIIRKEKKDKKILKKSLLESGSGNQISSNIKDDEEIILISDLSSVSNSKKVVIKEAFVKIAPLFLAKEELRKKQVFLQSGTPEVLKKKLLQQKRLEAELEGMNEFPVISHVLQCDDGCFPWNLISKQASDSFLRERKATLLTQKDVETLKKNEELNLGVFTCIPTPLANLLVSSRPPNFEDVVMDYDFNFISPMKDEYLPCFCISKSLKDGAASKVSPIDFERILRVSSWIMRSMMLPGVSYKMHVDLSSFLPAPSPKGFIFDHISALPTDQLCADLRKKMLLKLKEDYPGLPINRWFKIIHQKRKFYGGLHSYKNDEIENSEEKGASKTAVKNKQDQEVLSSESWTDIFSPRCFDDVCILGKNLSSLNKLKDWLQKWKDKGSRADKTSQAQGHDINQDSSSGDEFYCSDDENSDEKTKKSGKLPNVAILIGECGSGKTSGFYGIAKELGFKVLEINASSKRSGKNLLDTVKEATRSHQVNSSPVHSFFKPSGGKIAAKKPKNLQQKQAEASGMSVIFVEDVDIVFDDRDDGFITALTSLTSSSKRPFILEVHTSGPLKMGSNNNLLLEEALIRSSPHLNTLLAKQTKSPLLLPFQLSSKNLNSEALLRLICLSEGVWVSKEWCECIFRESLGDFRHALQQAHFWAGSVARSRILHQGKDRYADEVLQDIKPSRNYDFYPDNKIVANPCGCKKTYNCSYPYSWMFKDYIKKLWLNVDGIINQGISNPVQIDHLHQDSRELKSTSFCNSDLHISETDSPLVTTKEHKMFVSPMEIETNIRNGNICLTKGEEFLSDKLSNETKIIMSCSPKEKSRKGKRRKKSSVSGRTFSNDNANLKDQENKANEEVPMEKNEISVNDYKSKLTSHAAMKSYFKVLDLLSTCDVLLCKTERRESDNLGMDMVFQMGILPNVINQFMHVIPSESSCEMNAKMQKTVSSASQAELILPLLPTNWMLRSKMLARDLLPSIRENCRAQKYLAIQGRGRTRLSYRHLSLRQFGPSLREALCNTLVDNAVTSSEELPEKES